MVASFIIQGISPPTKKVLNIFLNIFGFSMGIFFTKQVLWLCFMLFFIFGFYDAIDFYAYRIAMFSYRVPLRFIVLSAWIGSFGEKNIS